MRIATVVGRLLDLDPVDRLGLAQRRDLDLLGVARLEVAQVERLERALAALERRDQRARHHEHLAGVDVHHVAIAAAEHLAAEHQRLRAVGEHHRDRLAGVVEAVVLLGLVLDRADHLDRAHRGEVGELLDERVADRELALVGDRELGRRLRRLDGRRGRIDRWPRRGPSAGLGLGAPPVGVGARAAALDAQRAAGGLQLDRLEVGHGPVPHHDRARGRLGRLVASPGLVAVEQHHGEQAAVDDDSLHDDVSFLPRPRRRAGPLEIRRPTTSTSRGAPTVVATNQPACSRAVCLISFSFSLLI